MTLGSVVTSCLFNVAKFSAHVATAYGSGVMAGKWAKTPATVMWTKEAPLKFWGACLGIGAAATAAESYIYDNYLQKHVSSLLGHSEEV